MGMEFKPLEPEESKRLREALLANAEKGDALLVGKDTTFAGTATELHDEEVIAAIRSVPCHYQQR